MEARQGRLADRDSLGGNQRLPDSRDEALSEVGTGCALRCSDQVCSCLADRTCAYAIRWCGLLFTGSCSHGLPTSSVMLFVALLHAASAGMHYATRGLLHCRLELPCHSASLDEISSRARGKHAGRRRDRCRTHLLHAVLLRRIPLRRVLLRSSPGLGPTYRCPDSVFRLQRLNGTAEPQVEASCTRRTRPRSTKRPGLASERTRSDPNADALSQSRPQASLKPLHAPPRLLGF